MKKILSVALLVVTAALLLSTCGGATKKKDGTYDVGVLWRRFDDDFLTGFRKVMETRAGEYPALKLDMQDGKDDAGEMNNKLDVMISKDYDYIACVPVDSKMAEGLIQKCSKAKIPTVFFNTMPAEDILASYDKAYYVGAHAEDSGRISCQMMIDYWKNNQEIADKNHDGKMQLVIIKGINGHPDAEARTAAYYKTLDASGIPYEILKIDVANHEKSLGLDKMAAWITEFGINGIEGVLSNNDAMALGAVQAILNNGWNQGDPKKFLPVVGIDATVEALESVKSGAMLGTVLNDRALQSISVLSIIKCLSEGKAITPENLGLKVEVDGKYIWVPYQKVDDTNLEAMLKSMI